MAILRSPMRIVPRLIFLAIVAAALTPRPSPGPVVSAVDTGRGTRGDAAVRLPTSRLKLAPPEARAFLDRVLEHAPEGGAGVEGFRFVHWNDPDRLTRAAMGLKAVPGVDPDELIGRVMDLDGYPGRIAHVDVCRSLSVPDEDRPFEPIPFYQRITVPGVGQIQQVAMLVDLGTIKGYRVACWSLMPGETRALDPRDGARSAFNVGVWLAAPGVVGYAVNSWPRREDVNALQWFSMTTGSDALAGPIVERTIDGMAAWSLRTEGARAGDRSHAAPAHDPGRRRPTEDGDVGGLGDGS